MGRDKAYCQLLLNKIQFFNMERRGGLNPLVAPNTGLLIPREGPVFITPRFSRFLHTHQEVMQNFNSIPFDEIDRSLITEGDIEAIRGAMLVESHNPIYSRELLDYFSQDHEMAAFITTWSYEEMKHYGILRTYLEVTNLVDLVDLDRELIQTRAGPWGDAESRFTPVQSFAYTMLQEAVTGRFYHGFARNTEELVLKKILTDIGRDEFRHCQWYLEKAKEALGNNPNPHVRDEVDEALLGFGMPGPTFIQDYERYNAAMRKAAHIGAGDVVAVLKKAGDLVGKPHMLKLATSKEYRDKIMDGWQVDPKVVLSHFILG